nr:isoform 2 of ankyrin-3 [Quercus suber]
MEAVGTAVATLHLSDFALRLATVLVEYSRDTKIATKDREMLGEDAGGLMQSSKRLRQALDELAEALHLDLDTGAYRHESRLKAFATRVKWSLTKSEVHRLLERTTRLQQYTNALLLQEQHVSLQRLDVRQLAAATLAELQDTLNWLTPLCMRDVHQTIASRTGRGSGRWCLLSEEFVAWRTTQNSKLWCPGIPGAGKTVMASIMCEYLIVHLAEAVKSGTTGIAVVYLKYNDSTQTLEHILGVILRQLQEELKPVSQCLLDLYKAHATLKTSPSSGELSSVLSTIVQTFQNVYILVDALDECNEELRWGILDSLHSVAPQMHLLLTSRPLDSINEELKGFVQLPIKANRADLDLFIDQHIEKNRHLKCIALITKHRFLLARLHVESLAGAAALSIGHLREKLLSLPSTLQGTYEDVMARIEAQEEGHRMIAIKTLAWLSHAFRPLTFGELQHALTIEPGQTKLDREMLMDGSKITGLCAGLMVVHLLSDTVTFVHYTASEFFTDTHGNRFPGFHAAITISCATYLALEELSTASVWTLLCHYPFSCYAAQYIGDHARQAPEEALKPSAIQSIYQFLAHPCKCRALLSLLDTSDLIQSGFYASEPDSRSKIQASYDENTVNAVTTSVSVKCDPLSAATLAVNVQPKLKPDASATDFALSLSVGRTAAAKFKKLPEVTALHLAASMGLVQVASMLLSNVSEIDTVDESGKTALMVAIERGFEKAVELLLTRGASVSLDSEYGVEVLLLVTESDWHVYSGDQVKLNSVWSKPGVNLDETFWHTTSTALFLAVERGYIDITAFLLDGKVPVDARDSAGQTALHRAVRRGNLQLISLLLQHGASVDCKSDADRTPWSANLRTQNYSSLDSLLKAGPDPNVKGHQGVSEMYNVAENGELLVIRYMLESGSKPSIRTGAERNPVWDQSDTPLDSALKANQIQIVNILISVGCCESRDIDLSEGPPIYEDEKSDSFIYPSTLHDRRDHIYQISDPIDSLTNSLGIRRSLKRADMAEYPPSVDSFSVNDSLFDIRKFSVDHQMLDLRTKHQATWTGVIHMKRDWTGSWKIQKETKNGGEYDLRTSPDWARTNERGCRWSTESGVLLARTGVEGVTPWLTFEGGLDREVEDVVVACWTAKLWSESVVLHRRAHACATSRHSSLPTAVSQCKLRQTSMTSVPRKAMADAELARHKYVAAIRLPLAAVPHNELLVSAARSVNTLSIASLRQWMAPELHYWNDASPARHKLASGVVR